MRWTEQLVERGVDVQEGTTLTASDVTDLAAEMDLVVDEPASRSRARVTHSYVASQY